jgi:hypothetical protein
MAGRKLLRTAIGLAAFLSLPLVARGASGIDPSFGSGGIVRTQLGRDSIAWAVRVQPDGKPVIGGFASVVTNNLLGHAWTVARYTQAGALDLSFDGDGVAVTSFSSERVPDDSVQDVASSLTARSSQPERLWSEAPSTLRLLDTTPTEAWTRRSGPAAR